MTLIKLNAEQQKIANLGKSSNEMGAVRELELLKHATNFNNPHNLKADQIQAVRIDQINNYINVLTNPEKVYQCKDIQIYDPINGYVSGSDLNFSAEGDQIKLRCKNMYKSEAAGNFINCLGNSIALVNSDFESKITYFVFVFISSSGDIPDSSPNIYPKESDANGEWYLLTTFDDLQKTQAEKTYYDVILTKLPLASQLGFFIGFSLENSSTVTIDLPYTDGHLELQH